MHTDFSLPPAPELPGVSFVMPVLNEEAYLADAVHAIIAQHYPGEYELILALGPSTDGTNDVAQALSAQHPQVQLVHNPQRDIPIALNLAVHASRHPVIVRVDAHSELSPGYVERAVRQLQHTGAANIGGVMHAQGTSLVQRAIAGGYNSRLGLGGGTYHFSDTAHEAESAYLGVFPRSTFDRVGGFDPVVRRGEDWEFNFRVRQMGGAVWFDPQLRVTYWPRSSWKALIQQFFSTGSWRATLVKKHRSHTPWRFFVPGAYVVALCSALLVFALHVAGVIPVAAWWPWVLYSAPIMHAGVTLFVGLRMPETRGILGMLSGAFAVTLMHLSWGSGFIQGMLFGSGKIIDRSRAS